MPYRVKLKPSVVESLGKLSLTNRKRVAKKIDSLAANPRPRGVTKLAGEENFYRVRVGDYRIILSDSG